MSNEHKKQLRVGFVHPDLGIGGAERLVVDAAVALQKRGHEVVMFTSRHDPSRCFEETRDGTLVVHVLGSSLPQRLHPRIPLTILFSILRSLLLALLIITSTWLPAPAGFFNPLSRLERFDVFFVDQQSVCVPVLRFFLGTRIVFYCHFPDKLLSGGWEIDVDALGGGGVRRGRTGLLKRVYRWPIDRLEEFTTGQSDVILSNSQFSARVYAHAFPSLAKRPTRVVYPCIDTALYRADPKGKRRESKDVSLISSDRPTLLSLNRYEDKKNIQLALRAFSLLLSSLAPSSPLSQLRLVVAGGYDSSLPDNLRTLASLRALADSLSLTHATLTSTSTSPPPSDTHILFILNFSTAQRTHLLTASSTRALLYTPANEHFGIVPVEAMACGVPVLAADSGGPTETIVDLDMDTDTDYPNYQGDVPPPRNEDGTGLLRAPQPKVWTRALSALLLSPDETRARVGKAAKARVKAHFSAETLGREVEEACRAALALGDVHTELGDKLIWGGAGLMAFAAVNLGLLVWLNGGQS